MSGQNNLQNSPIGQCFNQGKYETRSRHSDTTDLFKFIRKIENKKVIKESDLKNLITMIDSHHISALKNFKDFFIRLRNQLLLGDHMWDQLVPINPNYKEKDVTSFAIPFSKYLHQQLRINRTIFGEIYESLRNKIYFYRYNSIAMNYLDENDPYAKFIKSKLSQIDEKTIEIAFPQLYFFYQTLQNFVENIYKIHTLSNTGNQIDDKKQKIVHSMAKQQHAALTQSSYSFTKPSEIFGTNLKFGDQQFYDIASFLQNSKLQVSLYTKNGPFSSNPKKQFKSIPIQCIGCAAILYEGQPIIRDRSSLTNFEVIKSVKDSKSRLIELIESFMNSPNGGVILSDCDDHLFEVYPKGFQTNMKTFESRKQSILDICKNSFKDLHVDKDFTIDFVILHDEDGNPIIRYHDYETGQTKTSFFITRLKIFGRKMTSQLKIPDENQNKLQKKQANKYLANEVTSYDMQSIDYEQMKMRFYKNEKFLKLIDKPEIYQKIKKSFYNNEKKMDELLKGRTTPLFLHQNHPCKQSEMVMITNFGKRSQKISN